MRILRQNLIWMQCATAMVIFVAILPRGASDSGKNTDYSLCFFVYEDFLTICHNDKKCATTPKKCEIHSG